MVVAVDGRDSGTTGRWELIAEGTGIRWPEIDEDISVRGMLDGMPARKRGG
jgi:hypothetical protein